MALNLGTRDQPIHIDFSSNELKHPRPPEFSVASTSLSLPQRPSTTHIPLYSQVKLRNKSRGKVKTVLSPFGTPRVCNELLIAEPMTTHSQDVVQSLKRKRVDAEEEPDPELARRLKKSEKKCRKRERRAARVAQLGNGISSLHSPSAPFNVDLEPGPSYRSRDSSRGPVLQNVPLAITMPRPRWSTPESLLSMSSHGSYSQQEQNETKPGEEILGLNGQCLLSSSDPQVPLSTSIPVVPVHDPPQSSIDEDASDNLPNQVATVVDTPPPRSGSTSSSLNRRIKERMALLIEHQRLANGADSLPPAPLHRTTNCTHPESVVGETISAKQNTLDWAISENKAALVQLGAPLNKEEKLTLMKAVIERNKFITRLTTEIKKLLNSSMVVAPAPLPDSSAMRFKWPETELPLYLMLSNDDEDSDSAS